MTQDFKQPPSTLTVQAPQGPVDIPQDILTEHPVDERVLLTSDAQGLFAIHHPDVDAIILKNHLTQTFQETLSRQSTRSSIYDYILHMQCDSNASQIAFEHKTWILRMEEAETNLCKLYKNVAGCAPNIARRYETAIGKRCSAGTYHIDEPYSYLMSQSTIGPGLEWLPGTRDYNIVDKKISDNSELPPDIHPETASCGDIVLIKGDSHPGRTNPRKQFRSGEQCYSLIHRSSMGSPRLALIAYR